MNKLSRAQLNRLEQPLQHTKPHQSLHAELVDHIASLIEKQMDEGQSFQAAFDQVMQQANPQALDQLKQMYLREFGVRSPSTTVSRVRLRTKRRPETKPFQYMLLSSVITFLLLMGFLVVVSRPLAVPMDTFRNAWGAAGLMTILLIQWWLAHRLRKPKRTMTV